MNAITFICNDSSETRVHSGRGLLRLRITNDTGCRQQVMVRGTLPCGASSSVVIPLQTSPLAHVWEDEIKVPVDVFVRLSACAAGLRVMAESAPRSEPLVANGANAPRSSPRPVRSVWP